MGDAESTCWLADSPGPDGTLAGRKRGADRERFADRASEPLSPAAKQAAGWNSDRVAADGRLRRHEAANEKCEMGELSAIVIMQKPA